MQLNDAGVFKHVEAYCHMTYQTDDGRLTERIWNSRDGVTPFVTHSRDGREMRHVNWPQDCRDVWYRPKAGERIFIDLTRERATEYARKIIDRNWDHPKWPASKRYLDKETAVAMLVDDMMEHPGQPDIYEVVEDGEWPGRLKDLA